MPSDESPEARFNRLKHQIQESILRDYPNPERKGCPGDSVVSELAERPLDRPVEDSPYWHHITHCSECYREFLGFNNAFRRRALARRPVGWGIGVAAVIVVLVIVFAANRGWLFQKRPQNAEVAWPKTTLDIPSMERSANDGASTPIVLRRVRQELAVRLPVGSPAGRYEVQLTNGGRAVLSAMGEAKISDGVTAFMLRVDLSTVAPGNYSIRVRQVPFDWNHYPVVLR